MYTTRKGKGITGGEKRNRAIETYTTRKGKRITGGKKSKGTSYWLVQTSCIKKSKNIILIYKTQS